MQEVLQHFKSLCAIPHCSFETNSMREFLKEFAIKQGFTTSIDEGGNLHCVKGRPKLCLQAHFDMVCMGDAPKIEILEEKNIIKAKNSSLGADNGLGVALIMRMMSECENLECLFTDNEEVGLLGANKLNHKIISPRLLNLDHERDNELIIGCAGGVDIKAVLHSKKIAKQCKIYALKAKSFKGGHSGIDIIHNRANSIKEMAYFITQNDGHIISFEGGERINSIAKHAKALVSFEKEPLPSEFIEYEFIGEKELFILQESKNLLNAINAFAQGVRAYDEHLKIVQSSINLSLLKMQEKDDESLIEIELFARSNVKELLLRLEFESKSFFENFGFKTSSSNFYAPWQGKEGEFSDFVLKLMQEQNEKAQILAVHAGLECGVIEKKQELECLSLGPNIFYPHSTDEYFELDSLERVFMLLQRILKYYKALA